MKTGFMSKAANIIRLPLLQNFSAYVVSESASKITRLGVVVVLARFLSPTDIGIAVTAMATSDILKSLTENGVGQRIIIASDDDLEAECNIAHRIFWFWCIGLCCLQMSLAGGLWLLGATTQSALLLGALALEYLIMPAGLVQCALAMRAGKLKRTAAISGAQNVSANLLTCLMGIVYANPWALVLPKILTGPIWLIGMRRLVHWRPTGVIKPGSLRGFIRFGLPILGIEFLKVSRQQADKLIIGTLLGADALGVYFFAYNASVGISTSLSSAFSTVLFPYLSTSNDKTIALRNAIVLSLAIITPIVIVQTALAGPYVNLVFGSRWASVIPLVAILCPLAIPNMVWSVSAQWLRSKGRTGAELGYSLFIGIAISVATALAAPYGLIVIAWACLGAATFSQLVASLPALLTAFNGRFGMNVARVAGA